MTEELPSVDVQDTESDTNYIAASDREYTGNMVVPERKMTIYSMFDILKLSPTAIATKLSMDFRTVKAVLQRRDSDAIMARNLLDAHSLTAARAWVSAVDIAAQRGRHEPARDLLLHRKVIEPVSSNTVNTQVNVVLNGGSEPAELKALSSATYSQPPGDTGGGDPAR